VPLVTAYDPGHTCNTQQESGGLLQIAAQGRCRGGSQGQKWVGACLRSATGGGTAAGNHGAEPQYNFEHSNVTCRGLHNLSLASTTFVYKMNHASVRIITPSSSASANC
jgi:hypothetical protein